MGPKPILPKLEKWVSRLWVRFEILSQITNDKQTPEQMRCDTNKWSDHVQDIITLGNTDSVLWQVLL